MTYCGKADRVSGISKIYWFVLNASIFAYTDAYPAPTPRFGPLQVSHRQWPICANPYATRVTAHVGSNSETDRRVEMPPFRYLHGAAASGRGEIWMAVIAGNRLTRMSDYA